MAMFKRSKIYVAGHKGLLGSAILRRLQALGYKKIIVKTHNELDLTDSRAVREFFKREKPEYVFLSAGVTGGIVANINSPADFLHVNIMIQENVFFNAQEFGVKDLVFFGSSCMYPKFSKQPIKEEYLLTGLIEPSSEAYAAAKLAGVIACKAYNKQFQKGRYIALVPNTIYGTGDHFDPNSSHVLSALIKKICDARSAKQDTVILWGSGKPRREFIYCDDAADAAIFAINNTNRMDYAYYNIGTGVDYSIRDLAKIISQEAGYRGKIKWDTSKPDGVMRKLLDSLKFRQLGWKSKTGLRDGLKKAIAYYETIQRN